MKPVMKKLVPLSIAMLLSVTMFAQKKSLPTTNSLYKEFQLPGNAALPRVWWHWVDGNITKDGIRKDLLWMKRSGIGGFQNFDAALGTSQIVEKRLVYMTPEWKDAFQFTTKLADSLKLEMAIAGSPGWSESGGPWVPAKDGMKKYVWREINVKGGQPFAGTLPKPAAITGTFQNIPLRKDDLRMGIKPPSPPEFYKDIAVVAYRIPATHISLQQLSPKITSSAGDFNLYQLTDGDLATTNLLPSDSVKGFAWIQFEFSKPQTIKAVTVVGGADKGPLGLYGEKAQDRSLEASDDGVNFRRLTFIPGSDVLQQTMNVPATTARYYRVTFKNPVAPPNFGAVFGGGEKARKVPVGTDVAELALLPYTVIDRFQDKAGFAVYSEKYPLTEADASEAIRFTDVIDVTGKMSADGILNWTPPAGDWKIIRFGYSLTGHYNGPATVEATGLEVDKFDAQAVSAYFKNYLDQYKDATGGLMGSRGLQYIVTDSWEAGQANWTGNMMAEFARRRSYSMLPWMPVLTGQIVKSAEESERFLWDFRKTLSELVVENHYDLMTKLLAERGMKRYSESHESERALIADGMEIKRTSAVPMGAIWMPGFINGNNLTHYIADLRESASVAHIYGQNLVAAESLTAFGAFGNVAFSYSPETLKPVADLALASGLNRFIIHASIHQPVDDKIPGIGLGPFGQWFTRHETWAEQAKSWTSYLARSSYMLQQGKFVADVVYLYGEDNNITNLFAKKLPDVPEGYNYDFINADALINQLSLKDGQLVTPSGMSYRTLIVDSSARKMSLPLLRKIAQLAKAGAAIGGAKPETTPSLSDDQQEFQQLVNEVWNPGNSKVFTAKTAGEVLSALNLQPDFQYIKSQANTKLLYIHRKLSGGDIYWVNNRNDRNETLEAMFRVTGKVPQIWHPETGKIEPASYSIADGVTRVSLSLTPSDAIFVVFQTPATKTSLTLPAKTETAMATVEGPWTVSFQPNRGAPASVTFDKLISYTENSDAGIQYFSGTATYTKTINMPVKAIRNGSQILLDLGEVKNLAEVIVNGKSLGIVWKKPFRIDVTNILKAGENKMKIKLTNLWVNGLIGDAQPGVTNKATYTTMPFYKANSPLQPSGLLGPVKIISIR
jgi:hypothetical protein